MPRCQQTISQLEFLDFLALLAEVWWKALGKRLQVNCNCFLLRANSKFPGSTQQPWKECFAPLLWSTVHHSTTGCNTIPWLGMKLRSILNARKSAPKLNTSLSFQSVVQVARFSDDTRTIRAFRMNHNSIPNQGIILMLYKAREQNLASMVAGMIKEVVSWLWKKKRVQLQLTCYLSPEAKLQASNA